MGQRGMPLPLMFIWSAIDYTSGLGTPAFPLCPLPTPITTITTVSSPYRRRLWQHNPADYTAPARAWVPFPFRLANTIKGQVPSCIIRAGTIPRSLKKPRACSVFPLRSIPVVIVDDSTENVAAVHRPIALTTYLGNRNLLIEGLLRARCSDRIILHFLRQSA